MKIRKAVLLLACAVSWGIAVWFAGRLWAAYPLVSVRSDVPVTGRQLEALRSALRQEDGASALVPAFWSQAEGSAESRWETCGITAILYCGEYDAVYPAVLLEGRFPAAQENGKCAVSTAAAWQLWGSEDVLGQELEIEGDIYRVCGLFRSSASLALCGESLDHGFSNILYFMIVFSMCVSRFNVIMTIMGGQLTRVEEINLLPFHSVRENLQYGRNPISWDMLYNMVMFVPFGIIYCYYQKHFRVYKAVGMSCLTTFFIESAQFILKTGVVDIDDFIVNTLGSLMGIMAYAILQQISFKNQKFEIHELIDISATMLPPMFIAFVAEMFLGDGSLKLLPVHGIVLLCYGIFVYVFLIGDFTRKAKVYYLACYVGIFCLSRVLL